METNGEKDVKVTPRWTPEQGYKLPSLDVLPKPREVWGGEGIYGMAVMVSQVYRPRVGGAPHVGDDLRGLRVSFSLVGTDEGRELPADEFLLHYERGREDEQLKAIIRNRAFHLARVLDRRNLLRHSQWDAAMDADELERLGILAPLEAAISVAMDETLRLARNGEEQQ